ncbi:PEGA domain-containing protein [Candidatus Saccharibacteria bacterium]|nr:PEGA domain-containing protein [Candidatus Saccharibacteria bacterium]
MHHKEIARRHSRRVIFTNILIVLVVVMLSGILVLYTMGYRLNRQLSFEQRGLLRVSSFPSGAQVLVGGAPSGRRTAARLELGEGTHKIGVNRAGYDTWQRSVTIRAGSVVWLDYVLLFPQRINEELVTELAAGSWSKLSGDGSTWVAGEVGAPTELVVVDLGRNRVSTVVHSIPLAESRTEEAELELLDLSDGGEVALFRRTITTTPTVGRRGATTESYWLVDLSAGRTTELAAMAALEPVEVGFSDRAGRNGFWVLDENDELWTYDAAARNGRQIASHVVRAERRGQQLLWTSWRGEGHWREAWLLEANGTRRHLMRWEEDFVWQLTAYMGDDFVVAASDGRLAVGKMGERVIDVAELRFGELPELWVTGRMIVAVEENRFVSYDLENEVVIEFDPRLEGLGGWMSEGVLYGWEDGRMVAVDFDGHNRRTLVRMVPESIVTRTSGNFIVYLAEDEESGKLQLRRFRL